MLSEQWRRAAGRRCGVGKADPLPGDPQRTSRRMLTLGDKAVGLRLRLAKEDGAGRIAHLMDTGSAPRQKLSWINRS